jgi:hypothetical protein
MLARLVVVAASMTCVFAANGFATVEIPPAFAWVRTCSSVSHAVAHRIDMLHRPQIRKVKALAWLPLNFMPLRPASTLTYLSTHSRTARYTQMRSSLLGARAACPFTL